MISTLHKRTDLLILILLITVSNSQEVYKKVIHNTDPQAKCLDGSPGLLYIHQGIEKDKFLLYFIGGGFCGQLTLSNTLESCYQRSKTQLGSSTFWPDFLTDSMTQGLVSLNNQTVYKNWTKVLFAYCDGSIHQGDNESPVEYKNTKLYFRGNKIVKSHLKWLVNNYQMDKASKILLSGGSAGGIASIIWGNYLQSIVKNPDAVYNSPDSGIFINSNTFKDNIPVIQTAMINLMKLAHVSQQSPIQECNKANPGEQYKCLFIEENYKFLRGKYLFINSQYDQWAIDNILQIKCLKNGTSGYTLKNCSPDQMKAIQSYRSKYLALINNFRSKGNWGIWTISCSQHVYQPYKDFYDSNLQRVPGNTGLTVKDATSKFVMEDQTLWTVDQKSWPGNEACAY